MVLLDGFGSMVRLPPLRVLWICLIDTRVDSMNRQGGRPVVVKKTGGRSGGGVLTEHGMRAMEYFWITYTDFKNYLGQRSARFEL